MLNTFHIFSNPSASEKSLPFYVGNGCLFFGKSLLYSFNKYCFSIIGKIFRWYFFKKKIRLSLNHGHMTTVFFRDLRFLKIYKGKYVNEVIFLQPFNVRRVFHFLEKPRKINIFTKRGFFIEKPYNKKLGKISAYL